MLVLLGFRADGRPIYTYAGGSEGAPEGDGGSDEDDDDEDEQDDDEGKMSESVRKALERARSDVKRAKTAARPYVALARELGMTPEQMRAKLTEAGKKDDEVDIEKVRREAAAEVMSRASRMILSSKVEALAANDFADPADAAMYLDLKDYEVDDDGKVDERQIKRDLKELLTRKPHLKRTSTKADFEGGARRTAEGPEDMNARIRNLARRS
jgi:hypothetical protein